jgi:hypothetical protein
MFCCGAGGGDATAGGSDVEEKFKVLEGRWVVEKEAIGEGGFGTVHLCKQLKTGKQRACKAMRLPSQLDREDFRHEVAILKQIKQHRNICHVVDSSEDARYGYLVMQSCSGGELFDRIAARKCTEKDAAMAVLDVLSALDFIHRQRIVHRDLKVRTAVAPSRTSRARGRRRGVCASPTRCAAVRAVRVRSPRTCCTRTRRPARRSS